MSANRIVVEIDAETGKLIAGTAKVKENIKSLGREAKKQREETNKLMAGWKGVTAAIAGIGAAVASARAATDFIKQAVSDASDLQEATSKMGELFKGSKDQIEAWANTAASRFGQSKTQAMDAASGFAIFGQAAGLSGNELVGFSTKLTELASDLASFNNTSPEDAITAISAALRGENEPIRRYGVLLNEATLRQEALRQGLIKTTSQALTPQQKVLAAYQIILRQTESAQGDFARTSDGLSNQLRILEANAKDLSSAIGKTLLPAATELTQHLNDKTIPALIGAGAYTREFVDAANSAARSAGLSEQQTSALANAAERLFGIMFPAKRALDELAAAEEFLAKKGDEVKATQEAAAQKIAEVSMESAKAAAEISNLNAVADELSGALETHAALIDGGNVLLGDRGQLLSEIVDFSKQDVALNESINLVLTERQNLSDVEIGAARDVATEKEKQLQLELAIAEAKAAGNEDEQKRLEWIREYNDALKEAREAGMKNPENYAERTANAATKNNRSTPIASRMPSGGGGGGGGESRQVDQLAATAAYQEILEDPANRNPDGSLKAGVLGQARAAGRRAQMAEARESRRMERGFGSTPREQQVSAAERLRRDLFIPKPGSPDFIGPMPNSAMQSRISELQAKYEKTMDPKSASMRAMQEAMQEASSQSQKDMMEASMSSSPGAKNQQSALATEATLAALKDVTIERLPQRVLR